MEAFADVVEHYVPLNKGHITTRQNIQMHHIPLKDTTDVLRDLAPSGLSSREGCGNTVRNVTGDPWAGVCDDEVFDPTPYAGAYVRYFVRHPTTQLMPRKVKTAFTGTDDDRAITGIHDIAFLARERDGVRGFEMRVGGGTSIMPRIAPTLYEFVEADNGEYLKVAEAMLRIFDRQDWLRVNRARARIKVLVDKFGIDELRRKVDEELEGDWVDERDFTPDPLLFVDDEEANAPAPPETFATPNGDLSEFERFRRRERDRPAPGGLQRRPGPRAARRPLARAVPRPRGHHARLQRRLRAHDRAPELRAALGARRVRVRRLAAPGRARPRRARRRRDRRRRELPRHGQLQARHHELDGPERRDPRAPRRDADRPTRSAARIHIKMSGCPNGCSQHHIANIGFYGASIKVGEHTIPAYIAHIGGNYEGGEVIYGGRLKVRLAAKRVPDAVERWVRMYEAERREGEEFNAFAERVGTKRFEDEVRELALPIEFSLETMNHFIDWSRNAPFQVIRGEGECAV